LFHHAVLGGWSAPLLLDELFTAYRTGSVPEESVPTARDFLAWLAAVDTSAAEQHWRAMVAALDGPARLPGAPTAVAHDLRRGTVHIPVRTGERLATVATLPRHHEHCGPRRRHPAPGQAHWEPGPGVRPRGVGPATGTVG
jgi:hypothetical protein